MCSLSVPLLTVHTLVLPVSVLHALLRRILDDTGASLFMSVGLRAADGRRDWLAREIADDPSSAPYVFDVLATGVPAHVPLAFPTETGPSRHGRLVLGTGESRGRIAVLAMDANGLVPVDEISLVGSGMHRISMRNRPTSTPVRTPTGMRVRRELERWSRTIGAFGGEDTWRRFIELKMTVVGVGRTGSLVAHALAAIGVRNLMLLDPDLVELHNVGESDAMRVRDVGMPKAVAVAHHLRCAFPVRNRIVNGIHGSVWDDRGIDIAKHSDVIFSCVDRDAARLATALIATTHHRVLVDIGTGVLLEDVDANQSRDRRARMGADVRVILPGEGCLLCRGGLVDYDGAVRELAGAADTSAQSRDRGAFGRRRGSLRSLNTVAVGAALRLLEAVVAGDGHGGWMRLDDDGTGRFHVNYPEPPDGRVDCPLCQRAGLGDAAI